MSDFEYSLYVTVNGFWRWQAACAEHAKEDNLATLDIEVLHSVNNRARNKRLHDICLIMNISEPHLVAYSLKKLVKKKLVEFKKNGRDRIYWASATGDAFCSRYREVRRRFLLKLVRERNIAVESLRNAAATMVQLSRAYEDARYAATLPSQFESRIEDVP